MNGIVNISNILKDSKPPEQQYPFDKLFAGRVSFVGDASCSLGKKIGMLEMGASVNFWTSGRLSMHDIINYILRQVGPCALWACTWAISEDAVTQILNRMHDGLITSFKLWIDPRVKVRNPTPLQMCLANFPVIIAPVHAKVCVFENETWKISVSGSMNFTSNPQPERGIIQCVESIVLNDKKVIEDEFNRKR